MLESALSSWVAFAVFLCIAIGGTCVFCALLVARTLPSRVLAKLNEFEERSIALERDQLSLRNDWARTIEEMEVFERSIERKRRQIAAGVSRIKATEEPPDQANNGNDPDAALRAIRARIYGGAK